VKPWHIGTAWMRFSLLFIATFLHSACVSLAFVGQKSQWNFTATCDTLTDPQHKGRGLITLIEGSDNVFRERTNTGLLNGAQWVWFSDYISILQLVLIPSAWKMMKLCDNGNKLGAASAVITRRDCFDVLWRVACSDVTSRKQIKLGPVTEHVCFCVAFGCPLLQCGRLKKKIFSTDPALPDILFPW
jgi:hypothetical protein